MKKGANMSILKLLQGAQNGQGLGQLASQFGLPEDKANQLAGMLAPAIGQATKKRAEAGGLGDVLGAFKGEDQAALFDDATQAASHDGQEKGAQFLEKILGGRDQAQELANEAATRAGADSAAVQKFLPALAAMAQGGLQKQMPDSQIDGMLSQSQSSGGGGLMGLVGGLLGGNKSAGGGMDMSMLNTLLDADGDGSVMDDVLDKFMKR